MKKLLTILQFTVYFLLSAHIAAASWWIDSYDTTIQVQEDSTLLITETITANFSEEPHHGIYRVIPKYIEKEDGHREKLRLSLVSITDEDGNAHNYYKSTTTDEIQYQIGNADILIQAPETYIITYEVANGLLYFEDHNEVYWNAIGTAWEANILNATATVTLPDSLTIEDEIGAICYAGSTGSTNQDCTFNQTNTNQVDFQTTGSLSPYEGFTIAVSFPLGHTTPPSDIIWIIQDHWPAIIVPIVFTILFIKWKNHGRDKKVHTVVPEYKPPQQISPIEAAILIDEKADIRDISAIIIDLAIRGFIKIEEIEKQKLAFFKSKDYKFHRLNKSDENSLKKFEQDLLEKIFGQRKTKELSDLKNKFYKHIPKLLEQMSDSAMEQKLFEKRPDKAKTTHTVTGSCSSVIGVAMLTILADITWGFTLGMSVLVSGILTIVFGYYMPKKTQYGQKLYEKILGLRMYIETAEKDRIKFHEKRKHFEKLLPYAMIFKQTNHWAKQFEDIYKTPPDWYSSTSWDTGTAFSMTHLISSIENASSSISSTMSSSPGGGGSGFSGGSVGGGGGGGGGGAW